MPDHDVVLDHPASPVGALGLTKEAGDSLLGLNAIEVVACSYSGCLNASQGIKRGLGIEMEPVAGMDALELPGGAAPR